MMKVCGVKVPRCYCSVVVFSLLWLLVFALWASLVAQWYVIHLPIVLAPGLRRSPGEGNNNPPQYSSLGNPMDRGAWRATVHGVAKEPEVT